MSSTRVVRAADRYVTSTAWGESRHCFSFGEHYDPDDVGLGLLTAFNEEVLPPGAGFDLHEHRDVEIVTWVLDGALDHEDSTGNGGVARAGVVRRTSAGRGISHSERNDASSSGPARFVQSWIRPAEPGGEPDHEQLDVSAALTSGELVVVASGRPQDLGRGGAVRIGQPGAVLRVARLERGSTVTLPAAPFVHLFVGRGKVDLDDSGATDADDAGVTTRSSTDRAAARGPVPLAQGDSVRVTDGTGATVTARSAAELLVWEMSEPHRP